MPQKVRVGVAAATALALLLLASASAGAPADPQTEYPSYLSKFSGWKTSKSKIWAQGGARQNIPFTLSKAGDWAVVSFDLSGPPCCKPIIIVSEVNISLSGEGLSSDDLNKALSVRVYAVDGSKFSEILGKKKDLKEALEALRASNIAKGARREIEDGRGGFTVKILPQPPKEFLRKLDIASTDVLSVLVTLNRDLNGNLRLRPSDVKVRCTCVGDAEIKELSAPDRSLAELGVCADPNFEGSLIVSLLNSGGSEIQNKRYAWKTVIANETKINVTSSRPREYKLTLKLTAIFGEKALERASVLLCRFEREGRNISSKEVTLPTPVPITTLPPSTKPSETTAPPTSPPPTTAPPTPPPAILPLAGIGIGAAGALISAVVFLRMGDLKGAARDLADAIPESGSFDEESAKNLERELRRLFKRAGVAEWAEKARDLASAVRHKRGTSPVIDNKSIQTIANAVGLQLRQELGGLRRDVGTATSGLYEAAEELRRINDSVREAVRGALRQELGTLRVGVRRDVEAAASSLSRAAEQLRSMAEELRRTRGEAVRKAAAETLESLGRKLEALRSKRDASMGIYDTSFLTKLLQVAEERLEEATKRLERDPEGALREARAAEAVLNSVEEFLSDDRITNRLARLRERGFTDAYVGRGG